METSSPEYRSEPACLRAVSGIERTLHPVVLRATSTLRRHPRDHLVGVHDVARLAVDAVRCVELKARRTVRAAHDFIDVRGTEPRARMAVFGAADRAAHFRVH